MLIGVSLRLTGQAFLAPSLRSVAFWLAKLRFAQQTGPRGLSPGTYWAEPNLSQVGQSCALKEASPLQGFALPYGLAKLTRVWALPTRLRRSRLSGLRPEERASLSRGTFRSLPKGRERAKGPLRNESEGFAWQCVALASPMLALSTRVGGPFGPSIFLSKTPENAPKTPIFAEKHLKMA